jgi:hypothetical protein
VRLQLKVGGYYIARNGLVIGPMLDSYEPSYPFTCDQKYWRASGEYLAFGDANELDLITEHADPSEIASDVQPSAEAVAQEIFELYNAQSEHTIAAGIELPAEDLHTLACSHSKRGDKLLEIRDRVKQSIAKQQELIAEISRLMEGGDQ